MLRKIILLKASLLLMGVSSCSSTPKVDAFQCILINVDQEGNKTPLDRWYWYCLNALTNEEKSIWLKDSDKCIREDKPCKFYGTDVLEIERVKKWYQESQQCSQ